MTRFSRENVLASLFEEEGVHSGDESMNTDTDSSDYDKSELSGDDESNYNLCFNCNGNLVSDSDILEATAIYYNCDIYLGMHSFKWSI